METRHNRPIFPWYKERLQTKFSLPSWHIINKSDADDCSQAPSWTQKTVSPVIFTTNPNHKCSTSTKVQKHPVSKKHACFSKQMIQKQKRREYVAAVEDKLTKNPLAQYPHYRDSMPVELFDKVLSVLYPDMCVNNNTTERQVTPLPFGCAEEKEEENSPEPNNLTVEK